MGESRHYVGRRVTHGFYVNRIATMARLEATHRDALLRAGSHAITAATNAIGSTTCGTAVAAFESLISSAATGRAALLHPH